MTRKSIPWDATADLESDADIADYLAAALKTGDLEDVTHAPSTIVRANPAFATLLSILNGLKVSSSIMPGVAAWTALSAEPIGSPGFRHCMKPDDGFLFQRFGAISDTEIQSNLNNYRIVLLK